MVDARFHHPSGAETLGALLAAVGREITLPDERAGRMLISGAEELALAGPAHIALAAHSNYADDLRHTTAGAVVVIPALLEAVPEASVPLVIDAPHELFADLLDHIYPGDTRAIIRAGLPVAGAEPLIEEGVIIGPNVVLGPGVEIGRNTVIGPNTVIGAGVAIGRDCTIASNCSIDCAYIGNKVVVHAGVRIGTEGFGWLDFGRSNRKVPQLGRVIVQDRVEIGANSTIDRGALGDTVIGEGTKIDNLVQIGHNCRIGRNCLIAAMSGLSGSTILGDGVLMGGGVGTSGHLSIGANSTIYGRAAVTKDWPPGSKLAGAPAQDIRDFWREIATMRRISKGDKR
jgi:UDP-3-O-[3-hydroxymyristoyl] glucosamine N-acyltransferase